ncbi:acyl-CoA synthetase, partial [Streptomyces celluloflavus]
MEYNLADLFESIADTVPGREALVYLDHPGCGAARPRPKPARGRAAHPPPPPHRAPGGAPPPHP